MFIVKLTNVHLVKENKFELRACASRRGTVSLGTISDAPFVQNGIPCPQINCATTGDRSNRWRHNHFSRGRLSGRGCSGGRGSSDCHPRHERPGGPWTLCGGRGREGWSRDDLSGAGVYHGSRRLLRCRLPVRYRSASGNDCDVSTAVELLLGPTAPTVMAVRRKTEIVAYSTKKSLKNFIYFLLFFNFFYLRVRVFIHLDNFSLVQRRHHYRWRTANFNMLCTHGHWAVRVL